MTKKAEPKTEEQIRASEIQPIANAIGDFLEEHFTGMDKKPADALEKLREEICAGKFSEGDKIDCDACRAEQRQKLITEIREEFGKQISDWLANHYLVKTGDQYRITRDEFILISKGIIPGKTLSESINEVCSGKPSRRENDG